MAEGQKNVLDVKSTTEYISTKESNEQQRNWTDEKWAKKAGESLSHYDPTRKHLDFEVTKGCVIQPIDRSRTIDQRMKDNLKARDVENPCDRQEMRQKRRILAKFICSGNTDRMREIAFGNQKVDYHKDADNSGVMRTKDIEEWAKDVYNFIARRYGEENIVSCYVHLDETSPHLHLALLPVKDGVLSYRAVFGENKKEESDNMTDLHTAYYLEVGKKWGLERGSNMAETMAKHRDTDEYKRDLVKEIERLEHKSKTLEEAIRTEERKLKAFTSMIANLEQKRETIQSEIDEIARQFGQEGVDTAELAERMRALRIKLEGIDNKIAERQQQLEETTAKLREIQERLEKTKAEHYSWQKISENDAGIKGLVYEHDALSHYVKTMGESFDPVLPTLTNHQKSILEESQFLELKDNTHDVLELGLFLFAGYIREATNYVESHGGSSSSMSGFGRKKDDDDDMWWRRCITKAASALKAGRGRGRRR